MEFEHQGRKLRVAKGGLRYSTKKDGERRFTLMHGDRPLARGFYTEGRVWYTDNAPSAPPANACRSALGLKPLEKKAAPKPEPKPAPKPKAAPKAKLPSSEDDTI